MALKERKYEYNQAILKNYNNKKYKLTVICCLRNKGIEDIDSKVQTEKGTVNEVKLENNISRAKSKIYELSICNPWNYFATFTINKEKYNRYDLEKYHKAFGQFLRNYNKKHSLNIKYLTIPEQHKDGAWHEHGFISGLPPDHLTIFELKDKLPSYIREKLKLGEPVYNWCPYAEKFGFCDFEFIKNEEAVSKYVTKYITKDLASSVKQINAHLFYCSNGLDKSVLMKKGTMSVNIEPDYENEYVKVKWYSGTTPPNTLVSMIR